MNQPRPPDPDFPRFSARPLPPYRYLPGRTPHPSRHPDGYAYGRPEPNVSTDAAALRTDWQASPHFRYGVDLYNQAYWFEAHEGWEDLWHHYESTDPLAHALQGLVQVAAAHLVRFLGRADGPAILLRRARRHLDLSRPAGKVVFGLNLAEWWDAEVTPYFTDSDRAPYPFLRPRLMADS